MERLIPKVPNDEIVDSISDKITFETSFENGVAIDLDMFKTVESFTFTKNDKEYVITELRAGATIAKPPFKYNIGDTVVVKCIIEHGVKFEKTTIHERFLERLKRDDGFVSVPVYKTKGIEGFIPEISIYESMADAVVSLGNKVDYNIVYCIEHV